MEARETQPSVRPARRVQPSGLAAGAAPPVVVVVALLFCIAACDNGARVGGSATTAPAPKVTYDASSVPADFVTLKHMTEDLVVRAPPGWAYLPQPFRRQNDILVALYPPGAVWTDDSPTRLYLHGHALPDGVTFDQFVRGHEHYTDGQTFLSSEPARLNGLPAHRWVTMAEATDVWPKTKRLMVAAVKWRTVYYAEFRALPEQYDQLAPLAEQAIASITIGEPKRWLTPPPPAIPRKRQPTADQKAQ